MLSRNDIQPKQTHLLIKAGFLPVSIDYRLCPEVKLLDGPMNDTYEALAWARNDLPSILFRQRPDVRIDGSGVVAIGWSTGGHLAMSLGWTAAKRGIQAPEAVLAFYCPTDYHDTFWKRLNLDEFGDAVTNEEGGDNIREGVQDRPITAYNVAQSSMHALGGWCAPRDARSRIALRMNIEAITVEILCHGLSYSPFPSREAPASLSEAIDLPIPTVEEVTAISPLAQIRNGVYVTPTFLVHGTNDDLIPWE